jgi:2-keto-4-pentenoate hydratase/2-oxohepta-3-ene-1,7-dioic acid hydratase in catechol pathway
MRLVTYRAANGARVGVQRDDGVHDGGFDGEMTELIAAGPAQLASVDRFADSSPALPDVELLAPLRPRSLRDFLTFERHLHNVFSRLGREISDEWYDVPGYYKGMPDTVIGPEAEIPWPAYSDHLDHELELAAIIGQPGRDISVDDALDHVFGWTIWNDLSARDVQARELPLNMGPGKAKDWDGSNVLGPCILTADAFDSSQARMAVRINGETWGGASSSEMHHSFAALIAYASQAQTLNPGELFGSGTAPGGSGIELDRRLAPGDLIEMEIEGIGVLRNRVGSRQGRH